jgi:hypothetical protein
MQQSRTFTAEEIIREAGITGISPHRTGRQYALCPDCSTGRRGFNQKSKCLAVNIDALGVRWFCNHCPTFKGGRYFEGRASTSTTPGSISDRAMPKGPRPTNGYAALQRTARAHWR